MKNRTLAFLASALQTAIELDPIYPRPDIAHAPHHEVHPAEHAHGSDHAHSSPGGHAEPAGDPMQLARAAAFLALLSGLSMPVGAMLGIRLKPHDTTVAQWIAIGAGALLFAVSVELYGHAIHSYHAGHFTEIPMAMLMFMSLFGAWFFTWISKHHDEDEDSDDEEEGEEREPCPHCGGLHHIGSFFCPHCGGKVGAVLKADSQNSSPARSPLQQEVLPQQKANTQTLSFHAAGDDDVAHDPNTPGAHIKKKKHAHGIGAMMRLAEGQKRVIAQKRWAHLREAMKKYHVIRYMQKTSSMRMGKNPTSSMTTSMKGDFLKHLAKAFKDTDDCGPSQKELDETQEEARKAAMTMYTMLLIDGVPEGILMGFMAAGGSLGVTFIISLAIANFPEAFAGGVLMQQGGVPIVQILGMWGGLACLVASLAGIACYGLLYFNPEYTGGHNVPFNVQFLVAVMEGLAGGAMISGISACMLPEAYERRDKKGHILLSGGFLCTFGFLLSVGIKIGLG
jgi:zinc transporter ZupT